MCAWPASVCNGSSAFDHDSLSARAVWSAGIGGLGATMHSADLPDSQFHSGYLSVQWLHLLGPRAGSVYARGEAQLSNDGLLPLEKFSLGGVNSVRGYRRSRYVRDEGWSASFEYRLPLVRLAVPRVSRRGNDGQLSLVLFVDAGRAWNHGEDSVRRARQARHPARRRPRACAGISPPIPMPKSCGAVCGVTLPTPVVTCRTAACIS